MYPEAKNDYVYYRIERNLPEMDFVWTEYHSEGLDACNFNFNRPEHHNFLTLKMLHGLLNKIRPWLTGKAPTPKVLFLKGEGDKAFCSGGDLMGLYKADQSLPENKRDFW
jgi:enoyl-CoA hydratase/carnithine racemase